VPPCVSSSFVSTMPRSGRLYPPLKQPLTTVITVSTKEEVMSVHVLSVTFCVPAGTSSEKRKSDAVGSPKAEKVPARVARLADITPEEPSSAEIVR